MKKYCKTCKNKLKYNSGEGLRDWNKRKFCNKKCYFRNKKKNFYPGQFKKGHKNSQGNKNGMWKGNKVSYRCLHKWVQRHLGIPKECKICKTEEIKRFDWANISRRYKRNLKDFVSLCRSCHKKYDLRNKKFPI